MAERSGLKVFVYGLRCRELATCPEDPSGAVFVNVDGDVSPCVFTSLPTRSPTITRFFAGQRVQTCKVAFGNVSTRDLDDIWQGAECKRFRESFGRRVRMAADPTELLSPLFEAASLPVLPESCGTCYRIFNV